MCEFTAVFTLLVALAAIALVALAGALALAAIAADAIIGRVIKWKERIND